MLLALLLLACEWPAQPRHDATLQQLSDEVLRAEDIAIRRADTLIGPKGSRDDYARERTACMEKLFTVIMGNHGVTKQQIGLALRHRAFLPDAAVIGSFAALYALLWFPLARKLRRRYPLAVALFACVLGAAAALLIGEQWSTAWEIFRVGNGHLSYRTARIPWLHHRAALFAGGLAIAILIVGLTYRRRPESPQ